jgi:pyroglutamyl-peptidase
MTTASTESIILVTGFEPFGGRSVNTSWEAVRQLDGLVLGDGRRIVTLELPVVWETADDLLRIAIDEYQPDIVINVGEGAFNVEIERNAHNVARAIPDNDGQTLDSHFISSLGPDVYSTQLDIERILYAVESSNLDAIISADAGTYLCNFVSYSSYSYLAEVSPSTPTLFVHVPVIGDDDERLGEVVQTLLAIIVEASAQTPPQDSPAARVFQLDTQH